MKHALRVMAATAVVAVAAEAAIAYVIVIMGPPETLIPW